jgi:hypothetical protein
MLMMRYLIVFGLIFFNSCKSVKQPKGDMINIISINVYKDFEGPGYTTIGALTHFDEIKKEGIETIRVVDEDVERLGQILNQSKQYKHYQTKVGGNLTFCIITFKKKDLSESKAIIRVGIDTSIITDLSDRKDYIVKDSEDLKWLMESCYN